MQDPQVVAQLDLRGGLLWDQGHDASSRLHDRSFHGPSRRSRACLDRLGCQRPEGGPNIGPAGRRLDWSSRNRVACKVGDERLRQGGGGPIGAVVIKSVPARGGRRPARGALLIVLLVVLLAGGISCPRFYRGRRSTAVREREVL